MIVYVYNLFYSTFQFKTYKLVKSCTIVKILFHTLKLHINMLSVRNFLLSIAASFKTSFSFLSLKSSLIFTSCFFSLLTSPFKFIISFNRLTLKVFSFKNSGLVSLFWVSSFFVELLFLQISHFHEN